MSTKPPASHIKNWFSAPNPLLQSLPQFFELSDFVDALAFNPLLDINMNELSFVDRDGLLTGEKVPLEPTMQSLRAAMTWYGMLTTGLKARNPEVSAAKTHYWSTLRAANEGSAILLPTPTTGISINVIKGPTGTGKTVTQQRFCACIPPFIDHGRQEAAGWNGIRQLVYLSVMISHDGSRGGFILGILKQIDAVLGTNYSIDLPKRHRTVEKLAVATIGRLVAHYCGILFVDEAQLRNLVESGQAELMQMFLLLLMNSGIPLVLTGNERAFDWISYSQDISRLCLTPAEIFAPIGARNEPKADDEWAAVASGVMGYYVLRRPITDPVGCSAALRRYSGGIARLALTLWCAAQRDSLHNGRETVGPTDLVQSKESGALAGLGALADGFHYRKPELLMLYPDVDAAFYSALWEAPLPSGSATPVKGKSEAGASMPEPIKKARKTISEQAKFQKEQTRNRKRTEKRKAMKDSMSPDDIRNQGLSEYQLAGLAAAKAAVEGGAT